MSDIDVLYMKRALQLAQYGLGRVSPNPMVGSVIVCDGRIIGEGYHRCYGEAHAEVNAVDSVSESDRALLKESTVYVTLEPCAHFGKTPPCADMLVRCGVKRVVVGAVDPFDRVDGKGLEKLRCAGIEVETGILEDECRSLNAKFFIAHTLHRPFVLLKWAQSADGYMDCKRCGDAPAMSFSDSVGRTLVHRLRSTHDAIGIGSGTFITDCPRLDVRYWHGDNPRKVIFDRRGRFGEATGEIESVLSELYGKGITSIMVEGGPTLLGAFIDNGLWDCARVEVAESRLGDKGCAKAPAIACQPILSDRAGDNNVYYYTNNKLVNGYFIEHGL